MVITVNPALDDPGLLLLEPQGYSPKVYLNTRPALLPSHRRGDLSPELVVPPRQRQTKCTLTRKALPEK